MKNDLHSSISSVFNLELSARNIVEGTLSGLHKSPFHGFSTEFLERRSYINGESLKFLDWKYYAKTDKKFVKKYEEETNLRCHIILDVSSFMYYPRPLSANLEESKIGFATLLSAALMQVMSKQRDAIGLSMFSDEVEFYSQEKTNRSHFKALLGKLESNLLDSIENKRSRLYSCLHLLVERFHKRSMIVVISDFDDSEKDSAELFEALEHLSFNKHEILLFRIVDKATEDELGFEDSYNKFIDVESNKEITLENLELRQEFKKKVFQSSEVLRINALQYKMSYEEFDISQGFEPAIIQYLTQRKKIF